MISKKLFVGGINQDQSYPLVDTNEYLNALNIRFATTENGKVGQLSNVEGNLIKNNSGSFTLPSGTNECIGAYEDSPNRRVFFFNKNSSGSHGIYCYDADTDLVYIVLLNSQVTGGLGFSGFIHSIAMVDNLLYWTDGINPQRRINVEAAIKLNQAGYSTTVSPYSSPLDKSVITLIRNQPWAPLSIVKVTDGSYVNNFIKSESVQFAYRFIYRDGEVSTFSPISKLSNYNLASQAFNAIDVTIPVAQKIEQDVKTIEVAVKYAVGGNMFIVKSFTSGFDTHNSGTALTFRFYNDTVGIAVDNITAVKPFDSIPRTSKTLEVAKNRLFLGNNFDGYDTPSTTSLTISTAAAGSGSVIGLWYRIVYRSGGSTITRYWLYINDISTNPGYYVPASQPSIPIPSTSVDFTTLTYAGGNIGTIATYLGIAQSDILQLAYYSPNVTITNATPSSINGSLAFKSDSTYRAGIVFFDSAGRKCGVVTNDSIKAVTPDRNYSTVSFVTQINWSLNNNSNPAAQIPDWATHYSVVRTKCLRTSFFVQLRADSVHYIAKTATGEYDTPKHTYLSTDFGIAIKVTGLFGNGLGYSYQEGDLVKLYISGGSTYTLAVKDTYSDYVIVDLVDIGNTSSTAALFEIYTPYVGGTNELYYEVGDMYKIDNPGENTRKFSTISGSFTGDVYMLQRTIPSTHLCEAMSPNDKFWKNWITDIGRASIVINSGSISKPVSVYYSNVIIQGTATNGLSTFDALSQTNLPTDLKQIVRLMLTSKVQLEGTVMLAIGEQETASVYIGEQQIFDNTGSSFLATSSGVIGNVNVMRGSYGSINPESAFKWKGEVVYFDANKGSWVRYNTNGLFPISSNKMQKYFRKIGQDIIGNIKDSTEYSYASPNLPIRVLGGVDPYHEEYLCYTPKMYINPKNDILADMEMSSSTVNFTTVNSSMSVTPTTMTFSYVQGSGPSASQSAVFTGTSIAINGTVTITGSTNFEVSSDNISFSSSATFPYIGINRSATFYVRMKSGLIGGSYSGQVVGISDGTTSVQINVSGTVSVPVTPTIVATPNVLGGFSYVSGSGPSAVQTFVVTASNLSPASGNITITPPANYEISTTSGTSGFVSTPITMPYTSGGTIASGTVWVRLAAGLSVSSYNSQNIVLTGGGAPSVSVNCSGRVTSGTVTITVYPSSGFGNSESTACSMASAGMTSLFSDSDTSEFGIGSVVYTNRFGTTKLTGYTKIFMNGANWDVDPVTGVVIAYSSDQC